MKNKALSFTLFSALLFSPVLLWAAEHGEGHGLDEHQIKTIIYQSINVTIMFVGLFFFLRAPARKFFQTKRSTFVIAAEKAQKMRAEAEQQRLDIQVRLSKLQSTADESIARARAEAADYKNALVAEAHATSKRIKKEAEEAAVLEVEKAKNRLRDQMIQQATALATQQLESKMTGEDQRRLQGEFVEHLQAVRT